MLVFLVLSLLAVKKHMLGRHVMGWGWQEHVQDENNIKCIILARHFVKVGCDWIFT